MEVLRPKVLPAHVIDPYLIQHLICYMRTFTSTRKVVSVEKVAVYKKQTNIVAKLKYYLMITVHAHSSDIRFPYDDQNFTTLPYDDFVVHLSYKIRTYTYN
jgi:hypothetical protein